MASRSLHDALVGIVERLLTASSHEEEAKTLTELLVIVERQSVVQQQWIAWAVGSSDGDLLARLLLYTITRVFAPSGAPMDAVYKESALERVCALVMLDEESSGHEELYARLCRLMIQSMWSPEAMNVLVRVLRDIEDPRVRQKSLNLALDLLDNTVKSTSPMSTVSASMDVLLLGLTDVWSAIRKDFARRVRAILLRCPTVEAIDQFLDKLVKILSSDGSPWKAQEGALMAINSILQVITTEKSGLSKPTKENTTELPVQKLIKGTLVALSVSESPQTIFHLGEHHRHLAQLPRTLVTKLKPALYGTLKHDQVSVREISAQCLVHYMAICDESTRLLTFQEVMSKLNRLNPQETSQQVLKKEISPHAELLEAAEAEGLLDVLAKLVPWLPVSFFVKHWKFIFPTLECYVMHVASSVRQKSSVVVLALAQLSQTNDSVESLVLLNDMLLAIAETRHTGGVGWQRLEGRLLSVDVLVNILGRDLLWSKSGGAMLHCPTKSRSTPAASSWLPEGTMAQATWTLDEEEKTWLAKNRASTRGSVLETLSQHVSTTGQSTAGLFWSRVMRGWLVQTHEAFQSTQFELRRISRQLLPGLVRLCVWSGQLQPLLELSEDLQSDSGWHWSCLRSIFLHLEFVDHYLGTENTPLMNTQQLRAASQASLAKISQRDAPSDDAEAAVARVEALVMASLCSSSEPPSEGGRYECLQEALVEVHAHISPSCQLKGVASKKKRPDSSLDRQLSIALVLLLPTAATRLASSPTPADSTVALKLLMRVALSWLMTDDMFRWITVDQATAHQALLRTVSVVLAHDALHQDMELILQAVEAPLRGRLREGVYRSGLEIYASLWRAVYNERSAQGELSRTCILDRMASLVEQYNAPVISKTKSAATSEWDEWDDEEGEDETNQKAQEVRPTDDTNPGTRMDAILTTVVVERWQPAHLEACRVSLEACTQSEALRGDWGAHLTDTNETMDEANGVKIVRFSLPSRVSAASNASRKRPRLHTKDSGSHVPGHSVEVRLMELIEQLQEAENEVDKHYGLFIWPSAMVLAQFIASRYEDIVQDRVVLELGCGIALPGILAAKCGATKVYLSDRSDSEQIKRNVSANIALNGLEDVAAFLPLDWGSLDLADQLVALPPVDIVLAADCFYQSDDFEKVIATVAMVFRLNSQCRFYTTYQLRSINRSVAPLLTRWGMTAKAIDKSEFIHDDSADDSVYLYEITLATQ
ncbi:hypothetical protein Poli38472_000160 [Pythium oligandrum]|uniref:Uncharacterized protein n=1 Tax=Pythium oligandrum TaxID=41045 RepID=A0A8K1FIU8_PYTOL|nr:hypothetical protein Poli38472_000160 [Pythium oligandrum]|eukprot:TMW60118.1 hypothetical protein Poli38472_000160 [Pythium oligandrum]